MRCDLRSITALRTTVCCARHTDMATWVPIHQERYPSPPRRARWPVCHFDAGCGYLPPPPPRGHWPSSAFGPKRLSGDSTTQRAAQFNATLRLSDSTATPPPGDGSTMRDAPLPLHQQLAVIRLFLYFRQLISILLLHHIKIHTAKRLDCQQPLHAMCRDTLLKI